MSSTPSSVSPPPPGGPSPLTIGKSFLKQYYHVLSHSPDQMSKFYKPNSVLSDGEGSNPTTPSTLASLKDQQRLLKDRLTPEEGMRFELEHGAIDAQESVGGGILLVVTGHAVLPEENKKKKRRTFCHTFFLNPIDANAKKRQYYIHNDVLRFLKQEDAATPTLVEEGVQTADEEAPTPMEETSKQEPKEEPTKPSQEPKEGPAATTVQETPQEEPTTAKPDSSGGKEETKQQDGIKQQQQQQSGKGGRKSRRKSSSRSSSPNEKKKASPKPKPGSWASLVASGPPSPSPAAKSAAAAAAKSGEAVEASSSKEQLPVAEEKKEATTTHPQPKPQQHQQQQSSSIRPKRDPECTLVIKNIPEHTKEVEVRAIFDAPICGPTKAKIIGITVAGHRGLAFVDYDSPQPVMMALEQQQQKGRFRLQNGRVLDVEQKSLDRVGRGSKSARGRSPGSGAYRGSGGGGGRSSKRGGGGGGRGGGGRGGGR